MRLVGKKRRTGTTADFWRHFECQDGLRIYLHMIARSPKFYLLSVALAAICCSLSSNSAMSSGDAAQNRPAVRSYKLMRLSHRAADHVSPDALLFIAPNFDIRKPVKLIVYNHGLTNDVVETAEVWHLQKHMMNAPANTVMVLPEWAERPEEYSSRAGRFHQPNFFRGMLLEIMSKIPELHGKTMSDVKEIRIMTYSGGFRAAASEIYKNGLEDKIYSVSLLDSLYHGDTSFQHSGIRSLEFT